MRVTIRLLRSRLPGRLAWAFAGGQVQKGAAGAKAWRWATPGCLMPPQERETGRSGVGGWGRLMRSDVGSTEH